MYVTVPPPSATSPWVSAVASTAVMLSVWMASFDGPAVSLASSVATLIAVGWCPGIVRLSSSAAGGSLTSATATLTTAGRDAAWPSDEATRNVSVPKKSAPGVYVRFGAVPDSVPELPPRTEKVSGSPSGSDPVSVTGIAVSSTVAKDAASTTGGWFAAPNVTVTAPSVAHRASRTPAVVPSSHTV